MPSRRASSAMLSPLRRKVRLASPIPISKCLATLCLFSTAPTAMPISAQPRSGARRRMTACWMPLRSRSVAANRSSRLRARSSARSGLRQTIRIVCRNPLLAEERARKREDLLAATERDLSGIQQAVMRRRAPLRGCAEIGIAVGAVLNKHKVAKHFEIGIGEASLTFRRKGDSIAEEARLDGIYVVRTGVPAQALMPDETAQAYKDLARVERAFRNLKTADLEIRPVRHWTPDRVRAHVFLCMLAYHVEWHLRQTLAPLLFHDTEIAAARAERASPVTSTEPSEAA